MEFLSLCEDKYARKLTRLSIYQEIKMKLF